MHVYLTARHFDLTDDVRDYVERKIVEPLRGHTSLNIPRVEIQLYRGSERGPQIGCHILVELKGHTDINVREVAGDPQTAIDLAQERLMPLITEHKDRLLTLERHPTKYSPEKIERALKS